MFSDQRTICDATKGTDTSPRFVTASPARCLFYPLKPPYICKDLLVLVPF